MGWYEGRAVFVTGADGFIGSHLAEALVREGARVRALSYYNSFGTRGWLDDLAPEIAGEMQIVAGDVRDAEQMRACCRGVEVVFHLAALIAIPHSYEAPRSYLDTNVGGTLNILEGSRAAEVRRIVHTSTSEVFGSARYVPMDERHPRTAQSPYAATKIAADALVQSFWSTWDTPVTILRPFNTFGPRQSARAVIPTVVSQIAAGRREVELGSLSPLRDFLFVADTVAAFLALGATSGVEGVDFNAGTGIETPIEGLVHRIAELMGVDVELRQSAQRLRPATSEVLRLQADARKLRESTGWIPSVTLEDGLKRTIEWIRAHLDRYRPGEYAR
jgi:NAD dependent epimerase/dehydratase